ncbi:MAG: hydrogenase iron-sulfur subunit [Candidatus Thorarchaeota archaeon]|nr:hydrogenase iron-sulfur subunit [Candidatus Thorarchaeota archaeon]
MVTQLNLLKDEPKILIIATLACSYPGIDNAGQGHKEYPASTFVIRIPDPVIFPEEFYIQAFKEGYDGILIASCGDESPFKDSYKKLAARIDRTYQLMQKEGIEIERLRLTAICTVCADAFVKQVKQMYETLLELKKKKASTS